ncbi:hypothetical protein SLEP1_g3912 [Rubroshorea leprosula]|uniref:Uncharacterized protein n=1 Tax=Rubroshorea leprosula TaxID=152421 RepID=A0AAV5HT14_9ROSI|nr:hypothetical protein SLEP1_g3912 [Rubroshorea leprosula]
MKQATVGPLPGVAQDIPRSRLPISQAYMSLIHQEYWCQAIPT